MRMLHTMLRVGNMERSVKFYTEVLGMKLLRTTDRPEQKYSLAFVGYDGEDKSAVLELTYNYGVDKYDLGAGFGHIAIEIPDVKKACDAVRTKGGGPNDYIYVIIQPPGWEPLMKLCGSRAAISGLPESARSSCWASTKSNCGR